MATRAQVRQMLDGGVSYEVVAQTLKISPGEAFMLATGMPADGSDTPTDAQAAELPPSTQHLVGPVAHNPTRNPRVMAWVRERAARELSS
jgi:hypothetical protein